MINFNLSCYCKNIKTFFVKIIEKGYLTKFSQRSSKLNPKELIETIIYTQFNHRRASLDNYTESFEELTGKEISRQAFDGRINENTIDFLQEVLKDELRCVWNKHKPNPKLLKYFSEIYVMDSTSIELPEVLKDVFKGSGGAASKAAIKIQNVIKPITGEYKHFEITSGCVPDNKYAGICDEVIEQLEPNSLSLVDLGYFVSDFFKKLESKGCYYLTRYRTGTSVYLKEKPDKKINLCEYLKKVNIKRIIDIEVLLTEEKIPCRLIIYPLKDAVINERLRKKRKEYKKKRRELTKEMIEMLKWTIMITNAPVEMIKSKDVYEVYRLRWSVELVFKVWKGDFDFEYLKGYRKERVLFELLGKLITVVFLSIFNVGIFGMGREEISLKKIYTYF